jgi:hypothetical protein
MGSSTGVVRGADGLTPRDRQARRLDRPRPGIGADCRLPQAALRRSRTRGARQNGNPGPTAGPITGLTSRLPVAWTSTPASPPSSRRSTAASSRSSPPTPPRLPASTRTATASSPPSRPTWTIPPTAASPRTACSCRRPPSIAAFDRFAVTREATDGLPTPRFAPSQRAWVQSGCLTLLQQSVDASIPKDADNQ